MTSDTQSWRLVIDTSICGIALGLADPAGAVHWHHIIKETNGAGRYLSPLLERGLEVLQVHLDSVHDIVVSRGPGSFTGIRVGLAFAQGAIAASGGRLRAHGVSSLAAFCAQQSLEPGSSEAAVWVALPATQNSGYLVAAKGGNIFWMKAFDCARAEFPEGVPGKCFVTNGWSAFCDVFSSRCGNGSVPVAIAAEELAKSALLAMAKESIVEAEKYILDPIYLRRSTVEERLLGR